MADSESQNQPRGEAVQAAERGLRSADASLLATVKAGGPRGDVAAGVDRVVASAEQLYWASAVASGRTIQAQQKQAGQQAGEQAASTMTRSQ